MFGNIMYKTWISLLHFNFISQVKDQELISIKKSKLHNQK